MAKSTKKETAKVLRDVSIFDRLANFLLQFEESETLAKKVFGKDYDDAENKEAFCRSVICLSLSNYCISVMDGLNILEQKLEEKNADALFELCNAQYN